MIKRGTILWDRNIQMVVEVEYLSKDKKQCLLAPIWGEPGNDCRSTSFGRNMDYVYIYCKPIWKDFPVRKKKIKKDPMNQFHDTDTFGIEITINQAFIHTKEYICLN